MYLVQVFKARGVIYILCLSIFNYKFHFAFFIVVLENMSCRVISQLFCSFVVELEDWYFLT